MTGRGWVRRLPLALAALAAVGAAGASPPAAITLKASEHVIRITPRYEGELVHVEGTAAPPYEVVLKLTSPREDAVYSLKGKVGALWLSVGQVRFGGVPRMFKIKSTAPVDDILSTAQQVRYRLGRAGLKASMEVKGGLDRDLYLDELILIRERDRLFSFAEGRVEHEGNRFRASFFWPPDGPPGPYRVEAFAVDGGQVVGVAAVEVDVRAVGMESWIRSMASRHGVLYGLIAVSLAVAVGIGASVLFGSGVRFWAD